MSFESLNAAIAKFEICKCGHTRKNHEEEQPYLCCCLERGTTFRCDCDGFSLKIVQSAEPTTKVEGNDG